MSEKPNEPTLEELLAAIKGRCDAATPPPWGVRYINTADGKQLVAVNRTQEGWRDDDKRFIAASRTDVPRLLEVVQMALVELNQWASRPAYATCLLGITRILAGEGEDDV